MTQDPRELPPVNDTPLPPSQDPKEKPEIPPPKREAIPPPPPSIENHPPLPDISKDDLPPRRVPKKKENLSTKVKKMEFSTPIAEIQAPPPMPMPPAVNGPAGAQQGPGFAPNVVPVQQPEQQAAPKSQMASLLGSLQSNMSPEHTQGIMVALSVALVFFPSVQNKIVSAIKTESGTTWLVANSVIVAIVFMIVQRSGLF